MSLQTHQVLDYIQKSNVIQVLPRPSAEDKEYVDRMNGWYSDTRPVVAKAESFSINVDTTRFIDEEWEIVSDTAELLVKVDAFKLPFPTSWVDFSLDGLAYLYREMVDEVGKDYILAQAFIKVQDRLAVMGAMVRLYPIYKPETDKSFVHYEIDLLYASDEPHDKLHHIGEVACKHLSVFLSLMATRGVEREILPPPVKLNRARAKKGKAPIVVTTRLSLPTRNPITRRGDADSEETGRRGISPRLHWRRGHISHRWEADGRWIRPTLVGHVDKGMVGRKSYELKGNIDPQAFQR